MGRGIPSAIQNAEPLDELFTIYEDAPTVIKKPETVVAPSGILTAVQPAAVAAVTPNLSMPNLYIDQNKLAEQQAYQAKLLKDKEDALFAANLKIIADNEAARKEQEYQDSIKLQAQIAYQAQVTLAEEERKRKEQAAEAIAAAAAVNVVTNPVAAIDYVNKIASTINDLKDTTVADPNNYSAANAASEIANHIINFNEEIKTVVAENPTPQVIAAAEIINVAVAEIVATANDSMKDIIIKDQVVADNTFQYYNDIANSENATNADRTNAIEAEARLKEANNKLVEVQAIVADSKQAAAEIKAEVESKAAEAKLEKKKLNPKELSWLDKVVNYIYKQIYIK